MTTQSEPGAVSRADNLTDGGGATLDRGWTSNYVQICNDHGSHASHDVQLYRPVPPPGFFIIGDYAQRIHNYKYDDKTQPEGSAVVVKPIDEDPKNPLVMRPFTYELTWNSFESNCEKFSIWRPVPPSENYVAVGYVAAKGFDMPNIENYRCLRKDVAGEIQKISLMTPKEKSALEIWRDKGSGAKFDVKLYRIESSPAYPNAFIADSTYDGKHDLKEFQLHFHMPDMTDFSFVVLEHSVGSGQWGEFRCATEGNGGTMFVRATRTGTETTAGWFREAVGSGAVIADMAFSDWPEKLDVAFRGTMSFTHNGHRYEGVDIVIGQGYKGFPILTHNWWIGGPHMNHQVNAANVVEGAMQAFNVKGKLVPIAEVVFVGDVGNTCVFYMRVPL